MNNQNISQLYNKLTELVDGGNEQAVRDFLTEHIKEFPLDVQKKIVFEFFQEALDKKVENVELNTQIQKEGIKEIKDIDNAKSKILDSQKLGDIRQSLGL